MDKLSKFAVATKSSEDHLPTRDASEIFKLIKKYTDKIIDEQGKTIQVFKLLELEVAFMNFSIKNYPKNIEYVN
jgi:hypothetical protein